MEQQNILVTTHIYIYIYIFWKEYLHACSRYCAKITYVHILTILLPQTTHTHLKYFINIQIFVVSFIFIYIYAHWRANLTSRTHLHLKRNFHAIYLHLRGNSTSYIHLGSILVPFWNGHIFWKASYATYPQIYIFWNALLTIYSLCKVFLCHIFTHISTHYWKSISHVT